MVEVDISIPDHWPEGNEYISEPHEYFQEMAPIFCTTDIPFLAIGDHMQDYVRRNGLCEKLMTFFITLSIVVIFNILKWTRTVLTRLNPATASKKCQTPLTVLLS